MKAALLLNVECPICACVLDRIDVSSRAAPRQYMLRCSHCGRSWESPTAELTELPNDISLKPERVAAEGLLDDMLQAGAIACWTVRGRIFYSESKAREYAKSLVPGGIPRMSWILDANATPPRRPCEPNPAPPPPSS